jgi:heme/copper-type cytochrome/quinol oxidase subunit 2
MDLALLQCLVRLSTMSIDTQLNHPEAHFLNSTTMMIITAIALPVTALVVWIWIVIERVDREFRDELQGTHFDS